MSDHPEPYADDQPFDVVEALARVQGRVISAARLAELEAAEVDVQRLRVYVYETVAERDALIAAGNAMAAVLGPTVDFVQIFESENAQNLALLGALQLAAWRKMVPDPSGEDGGPFGV